MYSRTSSCCYFTMRAFLLFYLPCAIFLLTLLTVQGSIDSTERILRDLKKAYNIKNTTAVPPLLNRVYIFAEIYNDINFKYKNLTNERLNIRDTMRICTRRIRQLSDFKRLALNFVRQEVRYGNDMLKKRHEQVQKGEITKLEIPEVILPYINTFAFFSEKINEMIQNDNITAMVHDIRSESMRIIDSAAKDYFALIENEIFGKLQNMINFVMKKYRHQMQTSNMVDMLKAQTESLDDVEPDELDVFRFQYEIFKGLAVAKTWMTIIIQCQAILEGENDPFTRVTNTVNDQQSREYYGTNQNVTDTQ